MRRLCAHGHTADLRKAGTSDERTDAVSAWREAPGFTDAERAALRLTEAMTRLADRSHESLPQELWIEVAYHCDEKEPTTSKRRSCQR
ncbi:carboxymuconolactone decarboxylase family protein [Streptomyces sp. NPDC001920]